MLRIRARICHRLRQLCIPITYLSYNNRGLIRVGTRAPVTALEALAKPPEVASTMYIIFSQYILKTFS